MQEEIWKDIPGYEGLYVASNMGVVKRLAGYQASKERTLKPINNGTNYFGVGLCKNGRKKRLYVHRIIAMTFLSNPLNKEEVNHIDGNTQNNKLDNLEWVTRSENHIHRYSVLNRPATNKGRIGQNNWKAHIVYVYDLKGNLVKKIYGIQRAENEMGYWNGYIRHKQYFKKPSKYFFIVLPPPLWHKK